MFAKELQFNFTSQPKADYISINKGGHEDIPIYSEQAGYGFVNLTGAFPPRIVHTKRIQATDNGYTISEPYFSGHISENPDDYNHFGLAFRVKTPPGGYQIRIKTTCPTSDALISISGMRPNFPDSNDYWDAAKLIPVKNFTKITEDEWSFPYANGRDYIDIEVEPKGKNISVGLKEIIITPIPLNERSQDESPSVFLLGDSTVKSYIFEEAPMHGWGQVFHRLFNTDKVNIINYSMGGRSFKNAYSEGRLNDILLTGKAGDYIFIQFGHNDERTDEGDRFGRGSTENMYRSYIKNLYIPAIRSRGLIPVFVTPMSRIDSSLMEGRYYNSFVNRKFPEILKGMGMELNIPVIDLNTKSLDYYNEIGVKATKALFMSIEAGESPGKTNDGTYANGHPSNKIDGTHFKEALAHQFARIIVTEITRLKKEGNQVAAEIEGFLKSSVKKAIETDNWEDIFSQCCKDTLTGDNAYYRNQIEKLVQLKVMQKEEDGNFYPDVPMRTVEFRLALETLLKVKLDEMTTFNEEHLTREMMAVILYDAYCLKFGSQKPKYMTDYNDTSNHEENSENMKTYYPVTPFKKLTDAHQISTALFTKVRGAYELGLVRTEKGIVRGRISNGTSFEPGEVVTRAKAAKALYFIWVLSNPINVENDLSEIDEALIHQ
ncbi:Lysophospholipase L1 [Gracilibacillus ureilyticus]|uniref:Lysophospholipase L1 n=1 Tax=Gracilibacillus ureilyticus TaxID=531814 RepID=A0A1H9U7F0_9BACI|nr:SGNH/GDSL hydrolase family protein [Gracilibacillus ureilyticus]SES05385.1 Lysophospholipase L1 [Gracilibacillus ureilyticus]